jgi:hypothetical protein
MTKETRIMGPCLYIKAQSLPLAIVVLEKSDSVRKTPNRTDIRM